MSEYDYESMTGSGSSGSGSDNRRSNDDAAALDTPQSSTDTATDTQKSDV